jgi:selenocysteine lyase/cysteine desulfurase
MDVPATTRASFAYYNTVEEIDRLAVGLRKVIDLFGE